MKIGNAPKYIIIDTMHMHFFKRKEATTMVTFKELLQQSGMSRTQFSNYFDIPYRTIQNWELELRKCPEYLLKLMQYKLEKEGIKKEGNQ